MKDGSLSSEDAESVEIAQSCLSDIFKVDPSDESAMNDAIGRQSLLSVYGIYEKSKSGSSPAGEQKTEEATKASGTPTPESEELKSQGNLAVRRKEYAAAIDFYNKALEIVPDNTIYHSNRAAAYSASGDHESALKDAQKSVELDPKYVKGWTRLGTAHYALGNFAEAQEAYEKVIEAEGPPGSDSMRKALETATKRREESEATRQRSADGQDGGAPAGGMPDLSSLASMLGGGGGGDSGAGAGGGGMPDLSSIMNNPMMRSMAQNLMSNPEAMGNLLNNPQLRNLAGRFGGGGGGAGADAGGAGGGGGGPDLSSLLNDPSMAEM